MHLNLCFQLLIIQWINNLCAESMLKIKKIFKLVVWWKPRVFYSIDLISMEKLLYYHQFEYFTYHFVKKCHYSHYILILQKKGNPSIILHLDKLELMMQEKQTMSSRVSKMLTKVCVVCNAHYFKEVQRMIIIFIESKLLANRVLMVTLTIHNT